MTISHTEKKVILELSGVSKNYAFANKPGRDKDIWALQDVSFHAQNGEVLGIIGRNGAGKTTCLNIIAGVLTPSQGSVRLTGKTLGLFNLGVGFQDELSGRENIFLNGAILGARRKELEEKTEAIIDFSELGKFIEMPLGSYSQGMRLRLAFSIMACLDFDILVVDEVLAVGDILFQNKCFQKLLDFKRQGKTIILTSQGMEIIQRFCDKVACLDHGKLVFFGSAEEAIGRYQAVLNNEKFYVGRLEEKKPLITQTKKWLDDTSTWSRELGAKEALIEKVVYRQSILPGSPLDIDIDFTVRETIRDPHFGVAFFRNDGVYCYGPNTDFDGKNLGELKKGKGRCRLSCLKVDLAPGEYMISLAIWDKNEKIAYDYHNGCYPLTVKGSNPTNELLRLSYKDGLFSWKLFFQKSLFKKRMRLEVFQAAKNTANGISGENIKNASFAVLDKDCKETQAIFTNSAVRFSSQFSLFEPKNNRQYYLYAGLFRDDGVFCQDFIAAFDKDNKSMIEFLNFPLLPGGYKVSFGIWDDAVSKFILLRRDKSTIKMVFDRQDHGTVFLKHKWEITYEENKSG